MQNIIIVIICEITIFFNKSFKTQWIQIQDKFFEEMK